MTIKKTVITTSLLLAMSFSAPGFAENKPEIVDGDGVTIECITAADVDAMTDEDKAKLTLPICEAIQKNEDGTTTQ